MDKDFFYNLVKQRQSTRAYDTTRTVDREIIARILEAARLAPSACNAQPWHFIVVDEPELKNKVADAASARLLGMNHFTKQAPVHIIVVEEKVNISSGIGGIVKDKHFAFLDIGIAASHICLAAEAEGLGSCILGWFTESKMKNLLNIPDNRRVVLDIVIGYPAQPLREKRRKPVEEVISYNTYK
ncbi:MAG: nitroreductase family protein [Dysgonomonas sp.]|jgi:nitroreductase|uniref:nitroreductase family protein n=1 Tax=unclassified Dysgonomonas TaxID=2630389 RepID=UPI0025C223F8|nr:MULTISPECIES: nitroreductase family protein [unclassified Dysgonomonas]MDR2003288.1 nitroreductase family protein [Prevotella sp.]HMM03056.1 nitroreductase family protein [Dysgonomonas sp.]